jgi:hypothetical protein
MIFISFLLANFLLENGFGVSALPQATSEVTSSATPTSGTPSATAIAMASATASDTAADTTALSISVLNSLPIIQVEGDDSSAIVQGSNTSLVETHPELEIEPEAELPALPSVSDILRSHIQNLVKPLLIDLEFDTARSMRWWAFGVSSHPLDQCEATG